jgi:hypothetical protein
MRAIFAAAIILLCLTMVAPEPEHSTLLRGSVHPGHWESLASSVEVESSQPRGDRETIAAPPAADNGGQTPAAPQAPPAPAPNSDSASEQLPTPSATTTTPQVSVDDLCNALLTSAQDNDLPIAFFANLIWRESRLRDDAVSPKGALGIAQFMPKVAIASGLDNPFDPLQALAASARLLSALRDQFGNLGFVAAAYNAGAKRVSEWLQRRNTLPRETRGYVIDVTGSSVEQWQKAPQDAAELHFVRPLPCRAMPAFTELEQAQLQEAQAQQQQAQQTQAEQPAKPKAAKKIAARASTKRKRIAQREHVRTPLQHEKARIVEREHHRVEHEARERIRRVPPGRHWRA